MKTLILLTLAAIPLFALEVNFIYNDYEYDEYGDDYWYDEYWDHGCNYCNDYYVYYPHGHYCVYYVWYHPWWWDWYWWHCYWCHHFDWHFFGAGYYVVWYESGGWWWRPRYGRVVRYKLPYSYSEFRYKAREYGHNLPEKPPREINIAYNEKEVQRLTKEKDPELYTRLEKEHKSGNLEKMRKDYEKNVKKEISVKNEEYRKTKSVTDKSKNTSNDRYKWYDDRDYTKPADKDATTRDESRVTRKQRDTARDEEEYKGRYDKPRADDRGDQTVPRNKTIKRNTDDEKDSGDYHSDTKAPTRSSPSEGKENNDKKRADFSNSKSRR